MKPDVTLVLYRPSAEDMEAVLRTWVPLQAEIRQLRILVSGSSEQHGLAMHALRLLGNASVRLRHDNLGFAGGHNALLAEAFRAGACAVLVANPDLVIAPGSLLQLSGRVSSLDRACLVAPSLERLNENRLFTGTTDSQGIRWDHWGRHFDISQGETFTPDDRFTETMGVSGACMLVSRAAYDAVFSACGYFFDDFYLAYREDAELGVRARFVGVKSFVIGIPGFGHVRTVRGSKRGNRLQDLLGVKNRFLIKYNLGSNRPGNFILSHLRDFMVFGGTYVLERTSIPGYQAARRVRRAARSRGLAGAARARSDHPNPSFDYTRKGLLS